MKVRSRFSYFRDKLQVFFLGFLLGVVLCGGFFLLKLDDYVKELNLYKQLTQKDDDKDKKTEEVLAADLDNPKPKKVKKQSQSTAVSDTAPVAASGDTLSSPTPVVGNPGDEIVVKKDELLGQKPVQVITLGKQNDTTASADNAPPITVEFWRSPLNYRGYKFNRTRLVLFGFEMDDVQSIVKTDNSTYLKSAAGIYRLDLTSDFRQLERVTDETLIARIQ